MIPLFASVPRNWQVYDGQEMGDGSPGKRERSYRQRVTRALSMARSIDAFQPSRGADIAAATQPACDKHPQGNPGIKTVGQTEDVRVNGRAGRVWNL